MKSRYGISPWGEWFINVLDSYEMGARLDRGKTYANTGKVLSLEFDGGKAIAKVKGNYRPFYKVEIVFSPLKEAEQVYKMIDDDPPLLARIAAGELPESFLEKLISKKISLMPQKWQEMKRSCSCPDYGDPCKHMAALYYIIAREIDTDPHVLFRLRGLDLATRFGQAAVRSIAAPFEIKFTEQKKPQAPVKADAIMLEEIPHCGHLISTLLPANPQFCSKDFAMIIAEFYHCCTAYKAWESASMNEQELTETEHNFSRSNWKVICPNPVPGSEAFLQVQDINGKITDYTVYDAFSLFVHFSSDDGTDSYNFLFYLFKFLNLICGSNFFLTTLYSFTCLYKNN